MDARHSLKCHIREFNRLRNRCYWKTTFQEWCGFSRTIGNYTGNATEPKILVRMHVKNKQYQQNSHKWDLRVWLSVTSERYWASFKSLNCFTVRLFHGATICLAVTCMCCLKLHVTRPCTRIKIFFWVVVVVVVVVCVCVYGERVSPRVFIICILFCATSWSIGPQGISAFQTSLLLWRYSQGTFRSTAFMEDAFPANCMLARARLLYMRSGGGWFPTLLM